MTDSLCRKCKLVDSFIPCDDTTFPAGVDFLVVVVVVALLFYVHGKHLRSCRDGQLT